MYRPAPAFVLSLSLAFAWLPAERVLAAGDMLVHPVPYAGSQVPPQWARSLRALRETAR